MSTPRFPPVGLHRLVSVSTLLLGLGAVACGAQPQDQAFSRASEQAASPASIRQEGIVSHDGDEISPSIDPSDVDLSPLATQVVPLAPAFPERVLPGLAEAVGFVPLSVSIPEIGVNAASIVPVGLEDGGELEVPGAETVGWYRFGAGVDGGRGSAVLAAHIAYNGRDGVFRNLSDLAPGEVIMVNRDGADIEYEVRQVVQYDKFDLPVDDLFRESGDERLVLITCGGSFNPSLRSYDDNVVVVAYPLA